MSGTAASILYQRISRLRWQAPLLALMLVLLHQYVEHTWLRFLPHWQHFATQATFYGLIGPALAWWALSSLRDSVAETEEAEQRLQTARERLQKVNHRLSLLIRVLRRLAEAEDEQALLEAIVALPQQVLPVASVSLVQWDEQAGFFSPPVFHGNLAPATMAALSRQLAQQPNAPMCATCEAHSAKAAAPCALLGAVAKNAEVDGVYCFPLLRGNRRHGMLNVYLGLVAP